MPFKSSKRLSPEENTRKAEEAFLAGADTRPNIMVGSEDGEKKPSGGAVSERSVKFTLRLTRDEAASLEKAAEKHCRSMQKQILAVLRESFENDVT